MNLDTGRFRRRAAVLGIAAAVVSPLYAPLQAWSYDPATTHAGLTEQAVLASSLHRVLTRRLGRPLGLLEPLRLDDGRMDPQVRRSLWARFSALDPAGGYRPDNDGNASALAWVVAGAVLAQTPPDRGRHHFLDPRTGSGLEDDSGLAGIVHEVKTSADGAASVRDIATGTAFDLTGQPSVAWIVAPQNDLGLPALFDNLEASVTATDAGGRESALARALLALGGVLAVLEDAGEPAHVRNDFRGSFLERRSDSPWDRGSAYERFVMDHYGRTGVPAPGQPVRRPSVASYFTAPDGQGLADRTQREFFSVGTVPLPVRVGVDTTTHDVLIAASESLSFPAPRVLGLNLHQVGPRRYVTAGKRRVLGYRRLASSVEFFLDAAVFDDSAQALLPEVGAFAAGLIDHVLGADLVLSVAGGQVSVRFSGAVSGVAKLVGEDRRGQRREIQTIPVMESTFAGGRTVTVALPQDVVRIAAVFRGQDGPGGEPSIAVAEADAR